MKSLSQHLALGVVQIVWLPKFTQQFISRLSSWQWQVCQVSQGLLYYIIHIEHVQLHAHLALQLFCCSFRRKSGEYIRILLKMMRILMGGILDMG